MPCTVYEIPYDKGLANRINSFNAMIEGKIAAASVATDELREQLLAGNKPHLVTLPMSEQDYSFLVATGNSIEAKLSPPYTAPMPRIDRERLAILESLLVEWRELAVATPDKLDMVGLAKTQKAHRKHDIQRLIHHFAAKGDLTEVARLASVDLDKPLTPQLGYDPDSI